MAVSPNKRSDILNMTVGELEESNRKSKAEIKDHLNMIDRLNDTIVEQQQIINDLILPGDVKETPLYRRRWGTSNLGKGYKEGEILKQYQDDIRQKRQLIGFSQNMVRNAEIRIKTNMYDLRQLHQKPTKAAKPTLSKPRSKPRSTSRSRSRTRSGSRSRTRSGSKGSKKSPTKGGRKRRTKRRR